MRPKETVLAWVKAFNRADADDVARFYAEDAIRHPVTDLAQSGREAVREAYAREFRDADRVCLVENLFEDGEWAVLEWKDPQGLRGCACFRVVDGLIVLQRIYG
ncbi:nuclear transport factor 2 family protein [Mesoterricola sediminis]|uniref:SnoaL-like domain-containing protein n=1 Tax=Mesoterricola sediminis TaxID=2927980 RepID=A0AA48HGI7_9BACT|nr:nuclear transport factor 2 family protein [Mesoterricola sediminis]BDU77808.1 hypothetical protein METESE_27660 [Mesoterricola sediminis]